MEAFMNISILFEEFFREIEVFIRLTITKNPRIFLKNSHHCKKAPNHLKIYLKNIAILKKPQLL
jgi:hypothetical protein